MFSRCFNSCWFCIFVALLIPTLVAAQNNLFTTISQSAVASLPLAIATGDFNGDGFVDAAVTSSGTNAVSILIGTGDGNFKAAVNYQVGADPVAIVGGDFNHDGHLDLAVLNNNPNISGTGGSISILNGQGDGTFVAGATYAVGYEPTALATGDFDGDGNLDLAVVVSNPNLVFNPGFVTILMGSADGTFSAQANYGVGLIPSSIAVGDFNGDGRLDLVVGSPAVSLTNPQSEVSILINTGGGNFSTGGSAVIGGTGSVPISIAPADFNSDGRLDLAVALNNTNGLVICQGNGDGTLSVASSIIVGNNPIWLASADFNGDGKPDLMVDNNSDQTIMVLLGNGDETFSLSSTYPTGSSPEVFALNDLNGDGRLDAAIVNNGNSNVQVLLGENNGGFRAGTYTVGANASGITSGDFNRDGISDLAVVNGDASVTIFLADGNGGFHQLTPFAGCQSNSGISPGQILAADFNGDGTPGLAVVCNRPQSPEDSFLNLLTGNGDGTFQVRFGVDSAKASIIGITAADINGDDIPEIIGIAGLTVSAYSLKLTNFYEPLYLDFDHPSLQSVNVGDFNGDGRADLLLNTSDGAQILLQDGNGSFQSYFPGLSANILGDFNGDGLTDLLESFGGYVSVIALSNGDGSVRTGFEFNAPFTGLSSADFNGDGIPDILSFSQSPVYLGQDDGSFIDSGTLPLPFSYQTPVIGDFDGDGSPDVAVLDSSAATVSILLNTYAFQPTTTLLSQSATNIVVGQSFNLSASVSSKQGMPTGNVVFKQAGVPQTTVALAAGAAQATETAPSAIGQYGYTALYTGNGTFSGSLSQRLLVSVSAATSTTVVSSSKKNSKLGQSVTLTATIKPEYSGVPTGGVEFYSDGEPIGSGTVSGGQASMNISTLTQGSHTIEADYSGDASFITSLGLLTQKVGTASSTVTVASSANPSPYGQPVTLTATVTDSAGVTPTGTVVFSEGGTIYGSVALTGGVAQLALPQLSGGKHIIVVQYSGDNADDPAKANFTETIQPVSSATAITSSLNPSNYGQAVLFTATVSSTAGTPDGTVTFKNGNQALGTVTLAGGQAQLSVTTIDAGARTIKAVYNGSGTYATSQNSVQQVVVAAPTTVTLAGSPNPASFGQPVTFTATVSCATALPVGTVSFKDGKTVLATAAVINGQAQFTTSTLTTGTHNLTTTFKGSLDFAGSTSSMLQEVIN